MCRAEADVNTNAYNPDILLRWGANMDIQPCFSNQHACCQYVCSYIAKGESDDLKRVVDEALGNLPEGTSRFRQLQRIGTATLGQRAYSIQEAAYLVGGMKLRGSSRSTVRLSVGFAQNRMRMMASARAQREAADDDVVQVAANIIDYYSARPPALEDVTLFDFAANYDVVPAPPPQGPAAAWPAIRVGAVTRYVKERKKRACVRVGPRLTEERHADEYWYQFLLLFRPWRDEATLLQGRDGARLDTAEQAFHAWRAEILAASAGHRCADLDSQLIRPKIKEIVK